MNGDKAICVPVGGALFNYRVAGIAVQDGKILLHKRELDRFWSLPGGRVEILEFSADALVREMMEELGKEVVVGNLVVIAENFFQYQDQNYHETGFYYLMKIPGWVDFSDHTFVEEDEALLFRWLDIETLEEGIIYPEIRIQHVMANLDKVHHLRFGMEVLEG